MMVFTPKRLYTLDSVFTPTAEAACAYKLRAAIWPNRGAAAKNLTNDRRLGFSLNISKTSCELLPSTRVYAFSDRTTRVTCSRLGNPHHQGQGTPARLLHVSPDQIHEA